MRSGDAQDEQNVQDGQNLTALGLVIRFADAVLPAYQRRGIGKALVNAGLDECRKLGLQWCVVLGDPGYYRLFGFELAKPRGIGNEYNADEHFMLIELAAGSLPSSGVAKYAPEFAEVGE